MAAKAALKSAREALARADAAGALAAVQVRVAGTLSRERARVNCEPNDVSLRRNGRGSAEMLQAPVHAVGRRSRCAHLGMGAEDGP